MGRFVSSCLVLPGLASSCRVDAKIRGNHHTRKQMTSSSHLETPPQTNADKSSADNTAKSTQAREACAFVEFDAGARDRDALLYLLLISSKCPCRPWPHLSSRFHRGKQPGTPLRLIAKALSLSPWVCGFWPETGRKLEITVVKRMFFVCFSHVLSILHPAGLIRTYPAGLIRMSCRSPFRQSEGRRGGERKQRLRAGGTGRKRREGESERGREREGKRGGE